jgi:metal-responsive CopG/Arc/MetJ family transcriptional regulator
VVHLLMMNEKKQRLQFDVSLDTLATIDALRSEAGVATRAELIRRALRLYSWVLSQVSQGRKIMIQDGDDKTEIAIF